MQEFKKVNDYYDYLLGKLPVNNDIMKFIFNYFTRHTPEGIDDNPQYALVETTSRNNRQHIGETMLFGGSAYKGKQVLDTYEKIIVSMSAKHKFSPADVEEWYQRDCSYMLMGENKDGKKTIDRPQWHTNLGIVPKDKPKHSQQKKVITESDLVNYLNEYGERLYQELSLGDYPHYCVIVKPLSLRKKEVEEYLPIGNLYLFFCTKTYHSEAFYAELINYLVLVWLNCNWETLLTELKEREIQINQYLPNLKPAILTKFKTVKVNGHTLDRYYELFFDNPRQPRAIEEDYAKVVQLAFEYFNTKDTATTHWSAELEEFISNGGKKAMDIDTFEKELEKILRMRMFAMIATQVFKLPVPDLTNLFLTGYSRTVFRADTAITNYLHVQRWLTPGANTNLSRKEQEELFDNMLWCTSYHEKMILNDEVTKKMATLEADSDTFINCQQLSEKIVKMLLGKLD